MKLRAFIGALVCLLLVSGVAPAQIQEPGAPDSIIVMPCAGVANESPWPDSLGVEIYIWADDSIGGWSLAFSPDQLDELLTVSSVDTSGSVFSREGTWVWPAPTINSEINAIHFGAFDFSGADLVSSPQGLVATVWLQIDESAPLGSFVSLDSLSWSGQKSTRISIVTGTGGGGTTTLDRAPAFSNRSEAGLYNVVLGNAPPGIWPLGVDTVMVALNEDNTVDIMATDCNDADSIVLTVLETLPENSEFTDNGDGTGAFVFTPDETQEGVVTLSFVATDLDGLADTLEVVMVVGEGGAVIELESSTLPEEFTLSQNYPNPFNPTTTIDFSIPKSSHVRLEVFNVLGQSVRVLADEYLAAGFKRVQWDGTDSCGRPVASGIYLYRLTADQFGETRKMMLLK
jgi:hypothetical protein